MYNKIKYGALFVICLVALMQMGRFSGNADEATKKDALSTSNEQIEDMAKLQKLGESHDFVGLEKYAEKLQMMWSKRDWNDYVYMLYKISSAFNSYYFDNDKSYIFANTYANLALSNRTKLSPSMEADLVSLTSHWFVNIQKCPCGKDISKVRNREAELWFHIWKRIEDGIDKQYNPFDPSNITYMNVPPPKEAPFHIPGMSPEVIKDPKVRAEYEAAIQANAKKAQKNNEQIMLRDLKKIFLPRSQKFIIFVYSQLPDDTTGLQKLLNKYVADQTKRKEIMDAVKANLAKAMANKQKSK